MKNGWQIWRNRAHMIVGIVLVFAGCMSRVAKGQTPQDVPYFQNFESGTPAGWTTTRFLNATALTRFLGNFGRVGNTQESTTLSLNVAQDVTYTLIFDLMLIDSWDGSSRLWGPDWFTVEIDRQIVFRQTLQSAHTTTDPFTYDTSFDLGANYVGAYFLDTVYRKIVLSFTPRTNGTINITFRGEATEDRDNESWGIDNVRVIQSDQAAAYSAVFSDISRSSAFQYVSTTSIDWGSSPIWADIGNSGYLDVLVTGTTTRLQRYNPTTRLFTASAIGTNYARQACVTDIDNDGDLDIFGFMDTSGERFFVTRSNALLSSVNDLGLRASSNNRASAFFDVNRDGFVDVLMMSGTTNWYAPSSGRLASVTPPLPDAITTDITYSLAAPSGLNGAGDVGSGGSIATGDINGDNVLDIVYQFGTGRVFLSQPNGTYALASTGISLPNTATRLGMQLVDIDNDNDLDLVVANPIGEMQLWINTNGSFVNMAATRGLIAGINTRSLVVSDYTNDGYQDVYAIASNGEGNVSFRGSAYGTFAFFDDRADKDLNLVVANPIDAKQLWIKTNSSFVDSDTKSAQLADINTSSLLVSDYTYNEYQDMYAIAGTGEGNVSFRGSTDGTFTIFDDRARLPGVTCLDAATGDYDNDGDLDLIVTAFNSNSRLFRNEVNPTNYLKIRYVGMGNTTSGVGAPRDGTGTTIRLYNADGTVFLARRELGTARGLASAEPLMATFAVPSRAATYTVGVWSRGREHKIKVVPSQVSTVTGSTTLSQTLTINEVDLRKPLWVSQWREVSSARE